MWKQLKKTVFNAIHQVRLLIIHIDQVFEWTTDRGVGSFYFQGEKKIQCLHRKTSITGCAVTVENVNPEASLWEDDSDIGHPQKSGQNSWEYSDGKAPALQSWGDSAGEFHLQLLRFLSCLASPIPRTTPSPSSPSFPRRCGPGSLGLTLGHFPPPSQKWNLGARGGSPSMQHSFILEKPFDHKVI